MARIRTVKPELWTDPEFTECSLRARLLFIASWNFATDHGVLPDKPRQLKMQCLPADNCNIDALIEELVSHQFLVRRVAPNGDRVLVIRTFGKNQKINRPTAGRWGNPDDWPKPPPDDHDSVRPHGAITEHSPLDNSDNSDTPEADDSDCNPASVKRNVTSESPDLVLHIFPNIEEAS